MISKQICLIFLIIICTQLVFAAEYVGQLSTSNVEITADQEVTNSETSGGSSGSSLNCQIGKIKCLNLIQYKECLKSGINNKWSEVKKVSAGQECRSDNLIKSQSSSTNNAKNDLLVEDKESGKIIIIEKNEESSFNKIIPLFGIIFLVVIVCIYYIHRRAKKNISD